MKVPKKLYFACWEYSEHVNNNFLGNCNKKFVLNLIINNSYYLISTLT